MWRSNVRNESKDFHTLIDETKSDITGYLNKRLKSLKLTAYEKTAKAGSYIAYGLIIILVAYFLMILFLLALGFLLGEAIGSISAGFGILMAFTILCLCLFIYLGKKFRRSIANVIVSIIKKIEEDEE